MLTFAFRGTVADVDETTPDQPHHPAAVLLIEACETSSSVILPDDVLRDRRHLLRAGRYVEVFGEVEGFPPLRRTFARTGGKRWARRRTRRRSQITVRTLRP